MSEANVTPNLRQRAILVVAFDNGGLEPRGWFPQGGGGITHLMAAARVFESLGDKWNEMSLPDAETQSGPGGSVEISDGTVIDFTEKDVILCYNINDLMRPIHDILFGKAPHPIHLWAAGGICRSIANFNLGRGYAEQEMQRAMADQQRSAIMGGPGLPDDIKRRLG